jgi:hypothetical protein
MAERHKSILLLRKIVSSDFFELFPLKPVEIKFSEYREETRTKLSLFTLDILFRFVNF